MTTQDKLELAAGRIAQAAALLQAGRGEEALISLDSVLDDIPNFAPALIKRGSVYQALSRYDEAVADFERCLSLYPQMVHVRALRDGALMAELNSLDRATADSPQEQARIWEARGNLQARLQRDTDALDSFHRATRLDPRLIGAWAGMGHLLLRLQRHAEALHCYEHILVLEPNHAVTLFNRGNVLQQEGRFDEALDSYAAALERVPGSAEVQMEQAHCRLAQGQLEVGWPLFEARWNTRQLKGVRLPLSTPRWQGESLHEGQTLLLWSEQGLGDTLQFVRYLSLAARRAHQIALLVPRSLKFLLAHSVERIGESRIAVVAQGEPIPQHDSHCPLMSLPLVFGTTLESIPADTPYLHAPPASVARWPERLGARSKPRIGLVWAGGQRLLNNPTRDMRAGLLRPLLELDAEWIGLQQAISDADQAALAQLPPMLQLGDELEDFADTAGLIEQLDLVVSIDSSVAHLAGALGKPVCLMLRKSGEWRWLHDRSDTPWYPNHSLFRQQQHGAWGVVVEQVADYVRSWASQ